MVPVVLVVLVVLLLVMVLLVLLLEVSRWSGSTVDYYIYIYSGRSAFFSEYKNGIQKCMLTPE